jgi:hypothetical protein
VNRKEEKNYIGNFPCKRKTNTISFAMTFLSNHVNFVEFSSLCMGNSLFL